MRQIFKISAILLMSVLLAALGAPAKAGPKHGLDAAAIKEEAALQATAPAAAAALARALADDFEGREAAQIAADAPTDRRLFVGPRRAWIVISEHARLAEAREMAATYAGDGIPVTLLALRDGGYEIALGPQPVGRARRALARWRKDGFLGLEARLSSGAAYLARVETVEPK